MTNAARLEHILEDIINASGNERKSKRLQIQECTMQFPTVTPTDPKRNLINIMLSTFSVSDYKWAFC